MLKIEDIDDKNEYSYYEQCLINNIRQDNKHLLTLLKRNNNLSSSVYSYNQNGHNLLFFALICGYNPNAEICSYLKSILEHTEPDHVDITPKICEEDMLNFNLTPLHFAIGYKYNKVAFQLIKLNNINLILQRDKVGEEYGGKKNALELSIILKKNQLLQYMIERLQLAQYNVEEIRSEIKFNNQEDQKYFEEILQKAISNPSNVFRRPSSAQKTMRGRYK